MYCCILVFARKQLVFFHFFALFVYLPNIGVTARCRFLLFALKIDFVAVVSVDGIWMATNTLPTDMECRDPHMQDNFQTRTCTRPCDPRRVKNYAHTLICWYTRIPAMIMQTTLGGLFGSWPQSATPHLWRRHKTKAVVWFLTQMWRGTVFSQEISSFFRHRCGAQIGRLSFGGATAMVWQSMATNQTASNISN